MDYEPDRLGDSWENLVPEQPSRRDRLPVIVAVGAISLALICLCLVGGYILFQEISQDDETSSLPILPTRPGDEEPPVGETIPAEGTDHPETKTSATTAPTPAQETLEQVLPATATLQPSEPPPSTVADFEIGMVPVTPVIDGNLDEWGSTPAVESSYIVYQATGWDGTDDLSVAWQLAWDLDALYIAVFVSDDLHVQIESGNQIFRGDSIDIQMDTDRDGDHGPGLSPDDYQITLSPGDFASLPPSAFIFQGSSNGQILDKPGGHHIILQSRHLSNAYVIEAAIPWDDIDVVPEPGLTIGIALNANDNDTPGTAIQEVMKSHVADRSLTDPSSWGSLTLR